MGRQGFSTFLLGTLTSYCGSTTLVNHEGDETQGKTLRCRSWTCEFCRRGRHAQLVAEGVGGNPNRFITLTLRRDDTANKLAQAKRLSHAWRVICLRLKRMLGDKVEYLARLELTPGHQTPHLHILVRSKWIEQRDLSVMAAELLDAPNVWIEAIGKAVNVAAYIAKYLSKDDTKIGTCKRYWKSRGYDQRPPVEREASLWSYSPEAVHHAPIQSVAADYERLGWRISWNGPDRFSGKLEAWPWAHSPRPRAQGWQHSPPASAVVLSEPEAAFP